MKAKARVESFSPLSGEGAKPILFPEAQTSFDVANHAINTVKSEVDKMIQFKNLEKMIRPNASRTSISSIQKLIVNKQFLYPDTKVDDPVVIKELKNSDAEYIPELTLNDRYLIQNKVNPQDDACNDFISPMMDSYFNMEDKQINIAKKKNFGKIPKKSEANPTDPDLKSDLESLREVLKTDNSESKLSILKNSQKRTASRQNSSGTGGIFSKFTGSLAQSIAMLSKKTKKKDAPAEKPYDPEPYEVTELNPIQYNDGIQDFQIEKERMRINKREENLSNMRLLSPTSKRRLLKDKKNTREFFSSHTLSGLSMSVDGKVDSIRDITTRPSDRGQPSITYDEKGNQIGITAPNMDKLPNLMGNLAYFQQPTTEESEMDTVNILKNRSRALKQAASKSAAQRRKTELNHLQSFENLMKYSENKELFTEEGNLNIRENMKAGVGIVYQEENYKDSGPNYEEMFSLAGRDRYLARNPHKKVKYTRSEYNKKFIQGGTLKNRAIHFMREHFAATTQEMADGLDRKSEKYIHLSEADKMRSVTDGGQEEVSKLNLSELTQSKKKFGAPSREAQERALMKDSFLKMNQSLLSQGTLDRSQIRLPAGREDNNASLLEHSSNLKLLCGDNFEIDLKQLGKLTRKAAKNNSRSTVMSVFENDEAQLQVPGRDLKNEQQLGGKNGPFKHNPLTTTASGTTPVYTPGNSSIMKPMTGMDFRGRKGSQPTKYKGVFSSSSNRIVTASSELKIQQEQIQNAFTRTRQSHMVQSGENLVQYLSRQNFMKSQHRQRAKQSQGKTNLVDNNKGLFPEFADKHFTSQRFGSQMGTRAKHQRVMQKRMQKTFDFQKIDVYSSGAFLKKMGLGTESDVKVTEEPENL